MTGHFVPQTAQGIHWIMFDDPQLVGGFDHALVSAGTHGGKVFVTAVQDADGYRPDALMTGVLIALPGDVVLAGGYI